MVDIQSQLFSISVHHEVNFPNGREKERKNSFDSIYTVYRTNIVFPVYHICSLPKLILPPPFPSIQVEL